MAKRKILQLDVQQRQDRRTILRLPNEIGQACLSRDFGWAVALPGDIKSDQGQHSIVGARHSSGLVSPTWVLYIQQRITSKRLPVRGCAPPPDRAS
ncbi:MAG TPA: hypothetical protein VKQ36_05260, partial [Ktedonobacterales bacterium]|nr:hypothetical protein [Ktedonobacterales bacterium]